jgi:ketose-bisphosphate aldolase
VLRTLTELTDQSAVIPSFTCYNFEQALGVLHACSAAGGPAFCFLLAEKALRAPHGEALARLLVSMASASPSDVAVQLDHTNDLALIRRALDHGVSAVMADGSALPYTQNEEFTAAAAELCHQYGATAEGELGAIPGDEDNAQVHIGATSTDPLEARNFVVATGIDLLAVSIGNVHGVYRQTPQLDFEGLAALVCATDVPLSLHGTSGVPEDQLRRVFELGVRKFNVNTELRRAYFNCAAGLFATSQDGLNLLDASTQLIAATTFSASTFFATITGQGRVDECVNTATRE